MHCRATKLWSSDSASHAAANATTAAVGADGRTVLSQKSSLVAVHHNRPGPVANRASLLRRGSLPIPSALAYWSVNAVGPGIADANLEYGVTAATYPNLLSVTTYLSAYPQNTYVTTGFNVTDSTGSTTYETGTYNVPVSIVGYQVVPTPTPAPTPASNLNGQINQAVANVRCKVGSGFAGDGCAIAVNQIFSAALGHTIPRVEGGVKGDSPVPGSET